MGRGEDRKGRGGDGKGEPRRGEGMRPTPSCPPNPYFWIRPWITIESALGDDDSGLQHSCKTIP